VRFRLYPVQCRGGPLATQQTLPRLLDSRLRGNDNGAMKQPAVYILASQRNGTLYTGVTSDLVQRVWQHKNDSVDGFTKKYGVRTLVYYELHDDMENAIIREKRLKKWNRAWKLRLIEEKNPEWNDLYASII
jgi:putative endonuclease